MRWVLAVLAVLALPVVGAEAQLSNCSQTVGTASAAVAAKPTKFLEICNAHASNTLGVNFVGGAAAIGSAGTLTLTAGQCKRWEEAGLPTALAIIGSAASTTTACAYY